MKNSYPTDAVFDFVASPVGSLLLVGSSQGIHALLWDNGAADPETLKVTESLPRSRKNPWIIEARKQLKEYFSGARLEFDLPLIAEGTEFQKSTWKQLRKIPFGKTWTYGEQARKMRAPHKARAVGGANGRNPISILVPCHRVIGQNGKLTGFGGGLDRKKFLLEHEARILQSIA